ncbi:uncharacterized protein LOC129616226 [Condylostylus longicornis]|uniref:uncharacterized protein LOC129616226 n=1 Tax=Condylostylus longicornis TaxID=2530218 RepID=UPI00244DA305|nr:uncharacterized protein LOC129616226 [Condylostylus longicornis]
MTHPIFYAVPIAVAVCVALYSYFGIERRSQSSYSYSESSNSNRTFVVDTSGRCSICMSDIREREKTYLNCGHSFHSECIQKWLKVKSFCPNCRQQVQIR